jgi:beta-lactamase class A
MRYIIPLIITVVGGIALMGLSSVSPSEPLNVAAAKPEVTLGVDILRLTQVVDVDTSVNTTTEIIVAPTLSLDSEVIPTFATFDPTTNLLRLTPTKSDNGNHYIRFSDSETNSIIYSIDITRSQVDWSALRASLESYLGEYSSSYGIYIYDLNREQEFGINADVEFPPASIAKLTVAALVLRDVDAGR